MAALDGPLQISLLHKEAKQSIVFCFNKWTNNILITANKYEK